MNSTTTLARYHAQALDALGSLYYTGENFDNFSPVYGSTYPDFHGAVGVTVEQASSRGRVQESVNGLLTFPFTIRNRSPPGWAPCAARWPSAAACSTCRSSSSRAR